MVVGHVPEAVDFVVAGAGPGGYVAALRAAQSGRRVMLVEREGNDGIGGVCLRTGCIPSKALIEVAELKHRAEAQPMGLVMGQSGFDASRFQNAKTEMVARLTGGISHLLTNAHVEVIAGELSLTDPTTAVINLNDGNVRFVTFESLVLATGSAPIGLDDLPYDSDVVLDSADVLDLVELPASLAVVGAGYIGIELGTALAKLGTKVTLLDVAPRVLPGMDAEISHTVLRRLHALGVEFLPGTRPAGLETGALRTESSDGSSSVVSAERVLVAVGRRPNSADLGLQALDVALREDGLVPVGSNMMVAPRIAAIGDLTAGPALAHKAIAQAETAVDALAGKTVAFDPAVIPEVVFCDPEVASAGMSLEGAREYGLDAGVARFPLSASGRAATLGIEEGFTQIVFDRVDRSVLGAQMAGPHVSEIIAQAVLAIEMGASVEDLSLIVHPHPTLSETFGEAAHVAMNRALHISSNSS